MAKAQQADHVRHDVERIVSFDANMVLETTIGARAGAGRTLQFRLGDMPQAAVEKMLRYGAQRIFNDKVGGSDTTVEEKVAEAESLIERFKRGEIGRIAATGVDAVTRLARQKVRAALKATQPDAIKRLNELDKSEQAAKLDAILERNPHFREEAEKEIAAREKNVAKIDVEGVDL